MTQTILDTIVAHKRDELARRRPQLQDFTASLQSSVQQPAIIAEFKIASPSTGTIAKPNELPRLIEAYTNNGAAAISILTDENFFHGSLNHLTQAKQLTHLPILRKDFIIDSYQVYESFVAGADAILLIVSILSSSELQELNALAIALGMQTLVEVHTPTEAAMAVAVRPSMIGINTRDLHTMKTNLEIFAEVARYVPDDILLVAESGVSERADVEYVQSYGAKAVLVGTCLMKANDPGRYLASLCR